MLDFDWYFYCWFIDFACYVRTILSLFYCTWRDVEKFEKFSYGGTCALPDRIAICIYALVNNLQQESLTQNLFIRCLKGTSFMCLTARNYLLTTQLIGLDFTYMIINRNMYMQLTTIYNKSSWHCMLCELLNSFNAYQFQLGYSKNLFQ